MVHKAGPDKKFSVIRTFKVKSMNGEPVRTARAARAAAAAATCHILNLVLGPLDLNLLGLKIHLDKVWRSPSTPSPVPATCSATRRPAWPASDVGLGCLLGESSNPPADPHPRSAGSRPLTGTRSHHPQ